MLSMKSKKAILFAQYNESEEKEMTEMKTTRVTKDKKYLKKPLLVWLICALVVLVAFVVTALILRGQMPAQTLTDWGHGGLRHGKDVATSGMTGLHVAAMVFQLLFMGLGISLWLILAFMIKRMAEQSGMNGTLWLVLGIFFNVWALLAFLLIRGLLHTRCPHCGRWTSDADYCPHCGGTIKNKCPSCGASCKPGENYCSHCGAQLKEKPHGSENAGENNADKEDSAEEPAPEQ